MAAKANAGQIKVEMKKDIEMRDARIKDLKKEIASKKSRDILS